MKRTPSRTRVVHYSFDVECGGDFVFDVEARLAKAKAAGVITNYDDGRNRIPWFEGPPGAALRQLRDEFRQAKRRPCHHCIAHSEG